MIQKFKKLYRFINIHPSISGKNCRFFSNEVFPLTFFTFISKNRMMLTNWQSFYLFFGKLKMIRGFIFKSSYIVPTPVYLSQTLCRSLYIIWLFLSLDCKGKQTDTKWQLMYRVCISYISGPFIHEYIFIKFMRWDIFLSFVPQFKQKHVFNSLNSIVKQSTFERTKYKKNPTI